MRDLTTKRFWCQTIELWRVIVVVLALGACQTGPAADEAPSAPRTSGVGADLRPIGNGVTAGSVRFVARSGGVSA